MKTLIASLLIALSTASFAQTEQPSTESAVIPRSNSKVDVVVKKAEGTHLSIRIADQSGSILASQNLTKRNTAVRTQFDLSALPDGVYQVIITDGTTQKVQDVVLNTHEEATYRTVSMTE